MTDHEFTITVELDDLHEEMLDAVGQGDVEAMLEQQLDGDVETLIYQLFRQRQ